MLDYHVVTLLAHGLYNLKNIERLAICNGLGEPDDKTYTESNTPIDCNEGARATNTGAAVHNNRGIGYRLHKRLQLATQNQIFHLDIMVELKESFR